MNTTTFKLELIQDESGSYLLQGSCSGETLEYYDVDGEGGKATSTSITPWNQEVTYFPNVRYGKYDSEDTDSFWRALDRVLRSARAQGVELPAHNALDSF